MTDAGETKRFKARRMRYKKPNVRNLNLETITQDLWDIQEECENIRWYTDSENGADSLINALAGDEDEAKKKLKKITKDDLIAAIRQCFKIYYACVSPG